MAEAVRPKTKQKKHSDEIKINNSEVKSIEERSKSLHNFVNSIIIDENTKIKSDSKEQDSVKEEETVDTQFNEESNLKISNEVAKSIDEEQNFSKLNLVLDNIRLQEIINVPKAPEIAQDLSQQIDQTITILAYPKLRIVINEDENETRIDQVNEYEKILEQDYFFNELRDAYKPKCDLSQLQSGFLKIYNMHEFKYRNSKNEFFQLLKDYYESINLFDKSLNYLSYLLNEIDNQTKQKIWNFDKFAIESSAFCGDNHRLKHTLTSEKANLNSNELIKLSKMHKALISYLKTSFINSKYCCKLTYLKIEAYLNEFITNANVQFDDLSLKIDILFYYLRKKLAKNDQFHGSITKWLIKLIKIVLLKIPTAGFIDLLYRQMLNLPNKIVYQLLESINLCSLDLKFQIVTEKFDFYLSILSSFTHRVSDSRKSFLNDLIRSDSTSNNNWLIIDEDGKFENPEMIEIDISEDDLLKLYSQVNFSELYSHLWYIINNENTLQIISFLENMAQLTIKTLISYNTKTKYKNFAKLVSKTLKEILKFIFLMSSRIKSEHYDKFMQRLLVRIVYSYELNTLKWSTLAYLTEIKYLSNNSKWLLLLLVVGIDVFHRNFQYYLQMSTAQSVKYISQSCKYDLEEIIGYSKLSDYQLLSFLRTLNNIADHTSDLEMIKSILLILLNVSYFYKTTRDLCYKEGNAIIQTIINYHPQALSFIIDEITKENDEISNEENILSMCKCLPFNLWFDFINENDFVQLHKCLCCFKSNTQQFRIAQYVLDSLSSTKHEDKLKQVKVAILLYELNLRINCQFDDKNDELNLYYSRLPRDIKQNLLNWIWSVVIRLDLHANITEWIYTDEVVSNFFDRLKKNDTSNPLICYFDVIMIHSHVLLDFLSSETFNMLNEIYKNGLFVELFTLIEVILFKFSLKNDILEAFLSNVKSFNQVYRNMINNLTKYQLSRVLGIIINRLNEHEHDGSIRLNYLLCIISCLITSPTNLKANLKDIKWYKCQNTLQILDFILAHTFIHDFINQNLVEFIEKFIIIDFEISLENESMQQQQQASDTGLKQWLLPLNWISSAITYTFGYDQLSYDYNIYRNYPYLGFYLSICEENLIENRLRLTEAFRASLIVSSEDVNKLDNCWKKMLLNFGKKHNLNQNLKTSTLMIYKWCQRASYLPFDNPILVLYWQKFFNIYFKRHPGDYLAHHEQQIPFAVYYFTATTTLNEFIKMMKKSLEEAREFYTLKRKNEVLSNHYNERLEKLFHTFSLWIDETRLHDANLSLQALPSNYEPNLLEKIFNFNHNLWVEFVDLNRINTELRSLVPHAYKKDYCLRTEDSQPTLFWEKFKTENKDEKDNNEIFIFQNPLKEKFGEKILDIITDKTRNDESSYVFICKISDQLMTNVYKVSHEDINDYLDTIDKLNANYLNNSIKNLYTNQLCEKYVQVPCKSLLNPLHVCARAALIKFVYEHKEKNRTIKKEIKENRHKFNKIVDFFSSNEFPNDNCIVSMIALNSLIKKLLINSSILNLKLLKHLFEVLLKTYESYLNEYQPNEEGETEDSSSINLYLIDLINLIGNNYIKTSQSKGNLNEYLLDLIIKKLNSSGIKIFPMIQLLITYFEPKNENFFDEYSKSVSEILKYLNNHQTDPNLTNLKINIYLKLLSKFSLQKRKIESYNEFIRINIDYLDNLNKQAKALNGKINYKDVINAILMNLVSICELNFPLNVDPVLRKIVYLNIKKLTDKFNCLEPLEPLLELLKRNESSEQSMTLSSFKTNLELLSSNINIETNPKCLSDTFLYLLNQCIEKYQEKEEVLWLITSKFFTFWLNNFAGSQSRENYEIFLGSFLVQIDLFLAKFDSPESKNYFLNQKFNFYYDLVTNSNGKFIDNVNSLFSKHDFWIEFRPTYDTIQHFHSLVTSGKINVIKYLAFQVFSHLNLVDITASYYKINDLTGNQINNLLKYWLDIMTEFSLIDEIRDANKFEGLLRPVFIQAESLQWSLLSDESYSSVILNRFAFKADFNFVFETRGSNRGLLTNIFKAASEWFSNIDSISCFSSAKRRLFLKALCKILVNKFDSDRFLTQANQLALNNFMMNSLNDIEELSSKVGNEEINVIIDELLSVFEIKVKKIGEFLANIIETWMQESRTSPILLNISKRIGQNYALFKNHGTVYVNLVEKFFEIFPFKLELASTEIKLQNCELKCLENSSYLTLYVLMNQYHDSITQSCNMNELFEFCVKIINNLISVDGKDASKPKIEEEEKFILILIKLVEFFTELLNIDFEHNLIGVQLERLICVLNFYGEESFAINSTPSNFYSPSQTVLSNLSYSLLTKKIFYNTKFRVFCRLIAVAIAHQINFNNNQYKIRIDSSYIHDSSLKSPSIVVAKTNYQLLDDTKYSGNFNEVISHVKSTLKSKDFCFTQIVNLIQFLCRNLFYDKDFLK